MVEPRVAERLVPGREGCLVDLLGAAEALRDIVTGQLDVDAARVRSCRPVRLEEALDLVDDIVEPPRLVAVGSGEPIAVHRVGDPQRVGVDLLDRFKKRRKSVPNLASTHAGNEGETSGLAVRIELVDEPKHVVDLGRRAELDADRVAHARHVVHMGAVEVAGALPDPDKVCRGVDRCAVARVDSRHRTLVVHEQALVTRVELHALEFVEIGAGRLHELDGLVDIVGHLLVTHVRRIAGEALIPPVYLTQVGETTLREGANEIDRGCRGVVPLHETAGICLARLRREVEAVDDVAAVRRKGHVSAGLGVARARLGELSGHPAHLDHRGGGTVGEHHSHLQHRFDAIADGVGGRPGEGLGAVAALQQEGLAARGGGETLTQHVDLTGKDEGRQRSDLRRGCLHQRGIRPPGLLLDRQCAPVVETGDYGRICEYDRVIIAGKHRRSSSMRWGVRSG